MNFNVFIYLCLLQLFNLEDVTRKIPSTNKNTVFMLIFMIIYISHPGAATKWGIIFECLEH